MASIHGIDVGDHMVTTTVVTTIAQLNEKLGELLSTISFNLEESYRPIVALDVEQYYNQDDSKHHVTKKVAVVKLCYNRNCLIIQLMHMKEPPCSLAEFLEIQELSFVGVGIQHCLDALGRDYGLTCRNAVDLGLLAAIAKNHKHIKSVGLLDLAYELNVLKGCCWVWHKWNAMDLMGSWGVAMLSSHQIEAATWGSFLCSCVGELLIKGRGYTIEL